MWLVQGRQRMLHPLVVPVAVLLPLPDAHFHHPPSHLATVVADGRRQGLCKSDTRPFALRQDLAAFVDGLVLGGLDEERLGHRPA